MAERKAPTLKDKQQALWDIWKFADILGFHGGSAAFGDCHRELMAWDEQVELEGIDKTLVLMPRGHLKSTLKTVLKSLWRVYQNPNVRIFVGTATKELAQAFVREIKFWFEDEWLQENIWNARPHISGRLIPLMDKLARQRRLEVDETEAEDKKVLWRNDALQVIRPLILKEPTISVGAVGVQPTGFHFDELYLDDVVNYDNIATADKLKKLKRWVKDLASVLDLKRLDRWLKKILPKEAQRHAYVGNRISVVGTRYAKEDWYNDILKRKSFRSYVRNIYKDGVSSDGGYLWHEVWNEHVEAEKYEDIDDPVVWASQYLNKVIAAEDQVFNIEDFRAINPMQIKRTAGSNKIEVQFPEDDQPRVITLFMVVDPAAAIGSRADYTAIVIGGKDKYKNLYVVDGAVGKWKSDDILKNIYKLADKWELHTLWIESVGGFKHLAEYIRNNFFRFRPITINEFVPRGNKQVRISNDLQPLVNNRMLYLALWMLANAVIRDMFAYFGQPNEHDDFPDAVSALQEIAKPPANNVTSHKKKQAVNKRYGGYR